MRRGERERTVTVASYSHKITVFTFKKFLGPKNKDGVCCSRFKKNRQKMFLRPFPETWLFKIPIQEPRNREVVVVEVVVVVVVVVGADDVADDVVVVF